MSLWNDCTFPPTSRKVTCDVFFTRVGGGTAPPLVAAWVFFTNSFLKFKFYAKRALMAISICLVLISDQTCLLSLDCVLMSDKKKVLRKSLKVFLVSMKFS